MSFEEDDDLPEPVKLEKKEPGDNLKMVTLNGIGITENGKMVKSNYFRFLNQDLDDYSHIKFTVEEAKKIQTHLQKLSTGTSAMVPMMCAGAKCPFADRCPLQKIQKAPIGAQCLIEIQLMKEWIMKYFEEFDVDPNNFTEVSYVNELADIMIQEMRINMTLARPQNSDFIIDQVVGVDSQGDPIVQKQISPYIEIKDKLANRRSKIIKLMVGDRQEKYKKEAALKVRLDSDLSSQTAAMRSKIEGLKRALDSLSSPEDSSKGLSPEDIISSDD